MTGPALLHPNRPQALAFFFEQCANCQGLPRVYAEDWIAKKELMFVTWDFGPGVSGELKFLEYLNNDPSQACQNGWEYDGRNVPRWIAVASGQLQGAGKASDGTRPAP